MTDFDFCGYDDGLLATCSHDAYVKIWKIPQALLTETVQANAKVDPLVSEGGGGSDCNGSYPQARFARNVAGSAGGTVPPTIAIKA